MSKVKKLVLSSMLIISSTTLMGCGQIIETVQDLAGKERPMNSDYTQDNSTNSDYVDINGEKVKVPDNSIVLEGTKENLPVEVKQNTIENPIKEGFKVVGDDTYGWFQIPEDFGRFVDVNNPDPNIKQFSSQDKSFILTFYPIRNDVSHNEMVANFVDYMRNQGPNVLLMPGEVNGNKASELFQYYEKDDYTWHVWIVDEKDARKYISIEYEGEQEELKNNVLESYSLTEPQQADTPVVSKPSIDNSNPENMESDYNMEIVPHTNNFEVTYVQDYHIKFKVFGDDLKEGHTYYGSFYNHEDFETIGRMEQKAVRANDGSYYLDVDLRLNKPLKKVMYSFDIIDLDQENYYKEVEFSIK